MDWKFENRWKSLNKLVGMHVTLSRTTPQYYILIQGKQEQPQWNKLDNQRLVVLVAVLVIENVVAIFYFAQEDWLYFIIMSIII